LAFLGGIYCSCKPVFPLLNPISKEVAQAAFFDSSELILACFAVVSTKNHHGIGMPSRTIHPAITKAAERC
jgi:hypothetical protein